MSFFGPEFFRKDAGDIEWIPLHCHQCGWEEQLHPTKRYQIQDILDAHFEKHITELEAEVEKHLKQALGLCEGCVLADRGHRPCFAVDCECSCSDMMLARAPGG